MQDGVTATLKPGDKAGRYELLLQVAQGGMGAVWVARLKLENGFEKLFAVKTLLTHLADQNVFRDMFFDEARIAASIEHPNVCQILDLGEQQDLLYLVMEWVEGESLNALARAANAERSRIPYGVLLRVLADACAGLHAVHEHADRDGRPLEIVHRDVSPHNMLISSRGVTKIIDFGVAKARDRLTGATQSGNVKGKLRYMAPEQACSRPVDRRADIWGVGAVLYAMITNRFPFAGENDVAVLGAMIAGKAPDPLPPNVPEPLQRIVQRALSVDPMRRHRTAAELGQELEAAAQAMGVQTTQQGVAEYLEATCGKRVAKLRVAIRESIEQRGEIYSTIRRRSQPDIEPPRISIAPASARSASGTLGSSAIDRASLTPPVTPVVSARRALAAVGGIAVLATVLALVVKASTERATIPSASAAPVVAAPPAQPVAPAVAPPAIEPVPVVAAASSAPPPEPAPSAEPVRIDLDDPATAPLAAPNGTSAPVHKAADATKEPRGNAPTPASLAAATVAPKPAAPSRPSSAAAKKKLDPALESVIDTRR